MTACRPVINQVVKSILFFEILSSSEWNMSVKNKSFRPNYFIDISAILSDEDSFILSDLETKKIRMGQPVYKFSKFHNKLVTIYNKNNIIGIAVIKNNCIYPKRLINFNE